MRWKQGNRNSNERETSDENDNKIQIDAPRSSILAGDLRTRRCRPLLAMRRCARSVWLTTPHFAARCCTALIVKRTTAEGDAATTKVIESTSHKRRVQIFF